MAKHNEVKWDMVETQDWWNKLSLVYERLNVLGYQFERLRKAGQWPTEQQMQMQGRAIKDFYELLLSAGSDPDGPTVEECS